jgi:putative nucleotidyltransferase with HDIG domain
MVFWVACGFYFTSPIFANMYIPLTASENEILKKIGIAAQVLQLESYVVGGFVRDKILGRDTKDIDVVCIGDGIELAHEVAKQFKPTPAVNFFKNFGTAQIKIINASGEELEIEFVGARKESYAHESRNPVVMPGNLADDQNRRDFTINAMAVSLNQQDYGELLDPFDGIADLQQKIIRTPLQPEATFNDDPLRMMRAIRFATQLEFLIAPETLQAISRIAHRIKIISGERIADELNKILLSKKPSIGFDLLFKTGLLEHFFPQMVALAGAEYIDGKGHKDNFYHTIQVVDNIAAHTDDLWLRWAAVLHDIAKPATKKFEEGHGWTFHGHEVVGGRMVPKIFVQLKLPQNEKMKFVRKMVELHLRPISLTKENITDSAIRRLIFDAGDDLESLFILCRADITSKNQQKVKRYLDNFELVMQRCAEVEEKDHVRNWQPPITGEMIMSHFNLTPCRAVGIIKNAIREAILDGEIPNAYQPAFELMVAKGKEIGLDEAG